MSSETVIRDAEPSRSAPAPVSPGSSQAKGAHARRVRRLKIGVGAWGLWTALITALWITHEWSANGAFEHFGHEGLPGQWNPTLWALGVGVATLVVGIMALGLRFGRPTTDRTALLRQQIGFHGAAWLLGMTLLTPLWALIEWQDNGGWERWSSNSQPGDWDPWILSVGAIWLLSAIALLTTRHARHRILDGRGR